MNRHNYNNNKNKNNDFDFVNDNCILYRIDDKNHNNENIFCLNNKININYNFLNGRPSLYCKLNGEEVNCLLDTGASISVVDRTIVDKLQNIKINVSHTGNVKCANESKVTILGRAKLNVNIGDESHEINFYVSERLSPKVIAGIDFLNSFKIKLVKQEYKIMDDNVLCNIEANFGNKITNEDRINKALKCLDVDKNTKLGRLVVKFPNIFMANKWDIGCTKLAKHQIKTVGKPIALNPRRQPINLEEKINEAVRNLEENGIIRKCKSEWNTPLVCVWKKEKKDIRLCLDFRQLNQVTEKPVYPVPNINEMIDVLNGSVYFSSIDLGNAYYQVELDQESQEKTAFSTKSEKYCFTRMPFGISAAPFTFQKIMNEVLGELNWKQAIVYLDDILIFSKNKEEHYARLEEVFKKINNSGLRINPEKCKILQREVKFLGHIVNEKGIKTDPSKIEAVQNFERPKCVKQLRGFLGLCNYYRKFIKDYSKVAGCLESLCGRNKEKLVWTEECDNAFKNLKLALTKTPILAYPDVNKEFYLDTDASFDTIGAVLSQKDSYGNERVIEYASHKMSKHELGYCITRKELLAIYFFTQHFKHYLYGRKFTLRTDHKAITFMITTKKPITAQFQTWINFLSSLDMKLEYRKGILHTNADVLSRNKCDDCVQCQMYHKDAKKGKLKTKVLAMLNESNEFKWQENSTEIQNIKENISSGKETKFRKDSNIIVTTEGKIWIPRENKTKFIEHIHKSLCHAGSKKVINYIINEFDMENLRRCCKEEISKCENCQKSKTLTSSTKAPIIVQKADRIFEEIFIDFCGPFKSNYQNKKYIFGIIDQFSKYVSLNAVAKQDEKTTIDILLKEWILKFGAPKVIHLDCSKTFESNLMKNFAKEYNITLQFSSPYHHASNGLIERQFRTVREYMLASLKDKYYKNWVELLPEIEFSLNATIQKTIGCSPAELIFGKKISKVWINSKENRRETAIELAKRNQLKITYNNGNRIERNFNIGENVLVKNDNRKKDEDKYDGPFKIIDKKNNRSYILKRENGQVITRNIEWLKSFNRGGCEI